MTEASSNTSLATRYRLHERQSLQGAYLQVIHSIDPGFLLVGYWTYLSVLAEVNFQRFRVVLETERCHGEKNVFTIYGLSFLLLAFLRRCASQHAADPRHDSDFQVEVSVRL